MKSKVETVLISMAVTISILIAFSFTTSKNALPQEDRGNNSIPIGTIVAWAGEPEALPSNWKVCDGKGMSKSEYRKLQSRLGLFWGGDHGDNKDFFRLPDLQGVFLRGVNGSRTDEFRDPGENNRVNIVGKSSANVGSFQKDEVGNHRHQLSNQYSASSPTGGTSIPYYTETGGRRTDFYTKSNQGSETRPVNAYVYWIIKVK